MLRLFFSTCLAAFLGGALCAPTNVSIDDTDGSITYSPFTAWQRGQDCKNCTAMPDVSQAYGGSWHDATFNPPGGNSNAFPGTIISASVSFTGSAVYVYCILTGSASSPTGTSDMQFTLDGSVAGSFERTPNGDKTFQYNQLVFSQTGLKAGKHTLTLESGHNGAKALVLLDRIVYTTDDGVSQPPAPSSPAPPTQPPTQSPDLPPASSQTTSLVSTTSTTSSTTQTTSGGPTTPVGQSSATSSSPTPSSSSTSTIGPAPDSPAPPSQSTAGPAPASLASSSSPAGGVIAGAVLGALGGLLLLVLFVWYLLARRRQQREADEAEKAPVPYFAASPGGTRGGPGAADYGYGYGYGVSGHGAPGMGMVGSPVPHDMADWSSHWRSGYGAGMTGQSISAAHGQTPKGGPLLRQPSGSASSGFTSDPQQQGYLNASTNANVFADPPLNEKHHRVDRGPPVPDSEATLSPSHDSEIFPTYAHTSSDSETRGLPTTNANADVDARPPPVFRANHRAPPPVRPSLSGLQARARGQNGGTRPGVARKVVAFLTGSSSEHSSSSSSMGPASPTSPNALNVRGDAFSRMPPVAFHAPPLPPIPPARAQTVAPSSRMSSETAPPPYIASRT